MPSSLDITRICAEAAPLLYGAQLTGIEYYRKVRAVQVVAKGKKRYILTFSFHPHSHGFYILPAGKSQLDTPESYRPFARDLWNSRITALEQIPNDRIVLLGFEKEEETHYLAFEIIGPNGNLWLLDGEKRLQGSLRDKAFTAGGPYQPPPLPKKLDPFEVTADDLREVYDSDEIDNSARLLEKSLYGFDHVLARTALDQFDIAGAPDDDMFEQLSKRIREIAARYTDRDARVYAYTVRGKPAIYPSKVALDQEPVPYRSMSEAVRGEMRRVRKETEEESEREKTLAHIKMLIQKSRRLERKIEADVEEAADYETCLQFADLLKIHLDTLSRGMAEITVENLYRPGEKVTIPLDPKLTGQENIEQYARRYRKGKDGLGILKRRKANIREETVSLQQALNNFEDDFERAREDYPELLPREQVPGKPGETVRVPYKEYQTSTGLTVIVGKTDADNDRVTFRYARPHDYWFHTTQCPGSHVVLRLPHKRFEPSKQELAEAASLAAFYSKARNSARVPVSYTLRKYVRKPRKAKPGLVSIEREATIMVEPTELAKKDQGQ